MALVVFACPSFVGACMCTLSQAGVCFLPQTFLLPNGGGNTVGGGILFAPPPPLQIMSSVCVAAS